MKRFALTLCGLGLALVVQVGTLAQTITNQPQSLTINNASTALFTVGVANATTNALTYQWQLNGVPLTDTGTNYSIPGSISGSATSALTLDNVTSNQAGAYTVVINTNIISSNAVLNIIPGTVVTFSLSGLLTNASGSNLVVQLFDHDKPVTVANFLHYIRAGGYTNMFFDRCIPNFVLQGGDYGASDQTNTNTPFSGWDISSKFITDSNVYPSQIDSEFSVGPLIHNRFGTLAMALGSDPETGVTLTNSATSAFFINLGDNSGYPHELDTSENGPFTVFGRVVEGTNLLQYFNTLTNGVGIITSEVFSDNDVLETNTITTLPVDYIGTSEPANANLVFCDFEATNAPLDTNPPTVSLSPPAGVEPITNLQGTASDDVGVAVVICALTPQPAIDGTYPYPYTNGATITNYAVGTTNWSLSLSPGSYGVSVQAQDGAGNLSAAVTNTVLVTTVVTNGGGSVTFNENGTNINAIGYPFQNGADYNLVATPGTNQAFLDWSVGVPVYVDQELLVTMGDFVLTATFITNGLPNSIAFTYPTSNAIISTDYFNITGAISNVAEPLTVTCQIYSETTYSPVGPLLTESNATGAWSIAVNTNLPPDSYAIEAIATDSSSNSTVITEDFTVEPRLQLNIVGPGTVSAVTNGELITNGSSFQVTAIPNPGQLFYLWNNGAEFFANPVETFTMPSSGLTLTVTFISNTIPNSIAFTYPPANGIIPTNSFSISGTISGAAVAPVTVTCQIYSATTSLPVGSPLTNSGATNWSMPATNLSIGSYFVEASAVDADGNSTVITEDFTVEPQLQLNIVGPGTVSPVTNGEFFANGTRFQVTAVPNPGQLFYLWNNGAEVFTNPVETFTMPSGDLTLTVTFISNTIPNSIAFTYPPANGIIPTNSFSISGTISGAAVAPVTVTCQIYSATTSLPVGSPLTNSGATNWSMPATNLSIGSYFVEASAVDADGNRTAISEKFSVAAYATLQLNIAGPGTVSPVTNGEIILVGTVLQVAATPDDGQFFYSWNNGSQTSFNPAQTYTMSSGLTLTATFISNSIPGGIAFTYPLTNSIIGTNAFNVTGTISNTAPPVLVSCQIFSAATSNSVTPILTNSGVTNWSVAISNGITSTGSYIVEAEAMDSNGNTTLITNNFTVAANDPVQLSIVGSGAVSPITNGQSFLVGTLFQVTATPNPGQLFYGWSESAPSQISLNLSQTYTMVEGLALRATFITNNLPGMIAITYPQANGIIGVGPFNVTGTISNAPYAEVAAIIFSQATGLAVTQSKTGFGTSAWSVAVTNVLPEGSYTIEVIGGDLSGDSTMISENFTVQYAAALQLNIVGQGTVSPVTNGESLPIGSNFIVTATADPGQVFYAWNNGAQISTNATQTYSMASGLALTATFVPSNTAKGISITSPAAHADLSANTFPIKGKVAAAFKGAQITCQIFQTNGLAVGSPITTTTGTASWSVIASNLAGGNYFVEASVVNSTGLGAITSENFSVKAFAAAAGTYTGLFICTNAPVTPTNSGFLTFTIGAGGVMSGQLVFPAYAAIPIYSLPFENVDFTTGFTEFNLAKFHGHPVAGAIYLNLATGSAAAAGTISSSTNWSSELYCVRAVTKLSSNSIPPPGKYIFSLAPSDQTNGPGTNGYAAVTAGKDGILAVSGALPDNTTFSRSARISDDGVWPLCVVPNGDGSKGMFLGWGVFTNTGSSTGQLYWYKAANVGAYDKGGVGVESNNVLNSIGTNFYRPGPGGVYSIVFQGGTITAPITNILNVNSAGQFVVPTEAADKLKISLSAGGVLTGSIVNSNKPLPFKGAFISPSQGGSGFVPEGDGQMGVFNLELVP